METEMPHNDAPSLQTAFLLRMDIDCHPPSELGATPYGRRRVVNVSGGSFDGPRLRGKILPGGGDVALVRNDGVFEPNAQFVLLADDEMIRVTYKGVWHAAPAVLERLMKREGPVDPTEYYFRTAVTFETGAASYAWLNKLLAIGCGIPKAGGIVYNVHEVL
jgi:Protein of unknown function (DUF3237)